MKILSGWTRVVAVSLVGLSLAPLVGRSQQKGSGQQPGMPSTKDPFGQNQNNKPKLDEPPLGNNDEKLSILRNDDRQKKLVADSEKLLQLATQLNQDVEKTNQHILSIDVVKRADEIEKLAHSVKERMKGSA
jgi:hypothetical protein